MIISNITINNIKRYGTIDNSLNVALYSNKYNLLVAPNGFGKSSLALALDSLRSNGIVLKDELYYEGDKNLSPSISITLDGHVYIADSTHNCISPVIQPFVINSGLYVKANSQRYGRNFIQKGDMKIEDIVVQRNIPVKTSFRYRYTEEKRNFGINGNILPSLEDLFSNREFLSNFKDIFPNLDKYVSNQSKSREKLYSEIIEAIQRIKGSRDKVISQIDDNIFINIENEDNYHRISEFVEKYGITGHLNKFLVFIQLRHIYCTNKNELRTLSNRASFEISKDNLGKLIDGLCNPHYKIELIETRSRELKIVFPNASNISNGQRDVVTFVASVLRFKYNMKDARNYILVIDEVFDYLDDANFLAAQYYLSSILNKANNVIIMILTHLDPRYFRLSNVFSKKKLNVQFLKNIPVFKNSSLKRLIVFRENLDHKSALYKDISTYLFHFNPSEKELDFSHTDGYFTVLDDLNSTTKLKQYLASEMSKYLDELRQFDPFAICLGIRIRTEKLVYTHLTIDKRSGFISSNGTRKRFEFAESNGVDVDDVYYILGNLHSDINHLANEADEKVSMFQLEHLTIRHMIKGLFNDVNVTVADF